MGRTALLSVQDLPWLHEASHAISEAVRREGTRIYVKKAIHTWNLFTPQSTGSDTSNSQFFGYGNLAASVGVNRSHSPKKRSETQNLKTLSGLLQDFHSESLHRASRQAQVDRRSPHQTMDPNSAVIDHGRLRLARFQNLDLIY